MSIIGDLFLIVIGLVIGLAVAAWFFFRARKAEADLLDAQARIDALKTLETTSHCECEDLRRELGRTRNLMQGLSPYFPRRLGRF